VVSAINRGSASGGESAIHDVLGHQPPPGDLGPRAVRPADAAQPVELHQPFQGAACDVGMARPTLFVRHLPRAVRAAVVDVDHRELADQPGVGTGAGQNRPGPEHVVGSRGDLDPVSAQPQQIAGALGVIAEVGPAKAAPDAEVQSINSLTSASLIKGEITGKQGDTFTAGKLGKFTVGANNTVLLGDPYKFNKDNIDQFNF